jgi:hypothetical protein
LITCFLLRCMLLLLLLLQGGKILGTKNAVLPGLLTT